MQPLIDGDILVYECAAVGQFLEDGEVRLRAWDWLAELIDEKIEGICRAVGASQRPLIYLTGDEWLWKAKRRVRPSLPIYEPNFRMGVAKLRPYKGTRKVEKPYYYNAVRLYLLTKYNAFVAIGCEADDEMAIEQTKAIAEGRPTIICTRDKDLRQVAGWHYGWESGKQAEFYPQEYDALGNIELIRHTRPSGEQATKIVGGGFKFFCAQLIQGDVVDAIPGLPRYGAVAVDRILSPVSSIGESLAAVRSEYERVYPDDWRAQLREQCDLLWMIRHRDEEGKLVKFNVRDYA